MKHSYTKIIGLYWNFVKKNKRKVALVTFLLIVSSVAELYPAYGFSLIVDALAKYTPGDQLTAVYIVLILWLVSIVVRDVTGFFSKRIGYMIGESASLETEAYAVKHLSLLDISWHEKENTGNKMKRIFRGSRAMNDITRVFIKSFVKVIITTVGAIFIIATFNKFLALIIILYLISYYLISVTIRKRAIKAMHAVNVKDEELSGLWHEIISNIRSIKVLGMSKKIFSHTRKIISELDVLIAKRVTLFQAGFSVQMIWEGLIRVLLLGYIIWGISQGQYEVGFLVLFYGYFNTLTRAISQFTEATQEMAIARTNLSRLIELLDEPIAIDLSKGKKKFPAEWESIKINNLSFGYEDDNVLHDIDLEIKKGEKIGIVGLSGAGKSTFFKLLLKEHESYEGDILIGDMQLKDIKRESYVNHIAAVLQETEVFNMSLKENIVLANYRNARNKTFFEKAMKIAHINDFLPKLQDGVNTLIGEKGVKLSGGEKQRLGIARAVFKDPEILFLDEATSHLDVESEQKIQDTLKHFFQDVTAVVIAHRLSTIREMDRIIVIEDGTIIESGTFDELNEKSGRFRDFWDKQKM